MKTWILVLAALVLVGSARAAEERDRDTAEAREQRQRVAAAVRAEENRAAAVAREQQKRLAAAAHEQRKREAAARKEHDRVAAAARAQQQRVATAAHEQRQRATAVREARNRAAATTREQRKRVAAEARASHSRDSGGTREPRRRVTQARPPQMATDTVVWAGLDYSLVRLMGPGDFRRTNAIYPEMFATWNAMFLDRSADEVRLTLHRRLLVDVEGMTERNKLASPARITYVYDPKATFSHGGITPEEIAAAVRSYRLANEHGLGLVFLVDRLSKRDEKGIVQVVFFDIATRQVILTERVVASAGAGSFASHWFKVVKHVVPHLQKYRA